MVEVVATDAEIAAATDGRAHWALGDRAAVYAPPGAASEIHVKPVAQAQSHRE